jgi:hypothetical protein
MVKEIFKELNEDKKIQSPALELLQCSAEEYLSDYLDKKKLNRQPQ